jgi:hypothetical protein
MTFDEDAEELQAVRKRSAAQAPKIELRLKDTAAR